MKNSLPINKHSDNRRDMVEWITDFPIRNTKVITLKEDAELGNHYHKIKDEIFFMFKGGGTVVVEGVEEKFEEGDTLYIPAGKKHTFKLPAGSILMEAATKPYNKDDEHE